MPRGAHMKAKWADPEYRASQAAKVAENVRLANAKRTSDGRVDVACEECGATFSVAKYRADNDRPRWCKKTCMRAWQRRQTGEKSPKWKGGVRRQSRGYLLELCPDHPRADQHGYVFQHILVMERHLGYYIPYDYEVHHIDEKRDNNELGNLELLTPKEHKARHQRKRDPLTGRFLPD